MLLNIMFSFYKVNNSAPQILWRWKAALQPNVIDNTSEEAGSNWSPLANKMKEKEN